MKSSEEIYNLIGKNMQQLRKKYAKKSQEQLAEELDLSRGFISHIESPNVSKGVSIDTLFFMAQKYNFDIREFFDNYENLMKK